MSRRGSKSAGLPIIHARAAAIDVGARFHVAAVPAELCEEPVQTFQAFTSDIERMADWLVSLGIKTVAMESTGVYWVPVYEVLEDRGLEVVVANARDARAVPGRKSDVNDAQWLQRLHACGLLRASFRPGRDIAALRAYLRLRERHLDYAAAHIQHMQKALTFMNLQLHHVVSDVTGATGMKIIRAIVAGQRDPDVLARMRDVRCKADFETVRAALVGNYQPEHVFALKQALALYDFYQERVGECDAEIEQTLARLNVDKQCPAEPLPKARASDSTAQCRELRYPPAAIPAHRCRSDADPRHRAVPCAAPGRRVRYGSEPLADGQALHVVADTVARLQDQRRQGAVGAHAQDQAIAWLRIFAWPLQPSAERTPHWAPSTDAWPRASARPKR